jgi:hypothetical protein
MVVTSLTRPLASQPGNAHELSVHPAGMAVDLRVPADANSRRWLEQTLLALETARVLDVTREHHPSHFHVAVFPEAYRAWAAEHPVTTPSAAPAPGPRALPVIAPVVVTGPVPGGTSALGIAVLALAGSTLLAMAATLWKAGGAPLPASRR